MFGIRQKLLLGFASVLVTIGVVGTLTIIRTRELGDAIDVILRENYRSVIACQDMKESLERIDSGILFTLLGQDSEGSQLVESNIDRFRAALDAALGNITLPGERDMVERIQVLFAEYTKTIATVQDHARPRQERQSAYFVTLLPRFQDIKALAQSVLQLNQHNMQQASQSARLMAATAQTQLIAAILACAAISLLFGYLVQRWVLNPIRMLTRSASEIQHGQFDFVLPVVSSDEIGQLSQAFNTMVEGLRAAWREHRSELTRSRRATEELLAGLKDAFVVTDLEGNVEIATPAARQYFGLRPGVNAASMPYPWLYNSIRAAVEGGRTADDQSPEDVKQVFIDNHEHFFQPAMVPIRDAQGHATGVAVILKDVTQVRRQHELKHNLAATVSHQLKTPLTSISMGLHLLLDDKIGPLNEKQVELLIGARADCDRLTEILEGLLDIHLIESGRGLLELESVAPCQLVKDCAERFGVHARDRGINLNFEVPDNLPNVKADRSRVAHVFANLLDNALKMTRPGGNVTISARENPGTILFSVLDTGTGIAPENVPRVFDPFFRGADASGKTGAGLGLSIAKEIVNAHGGEMGVESRLGQGARFWFTLVRADEHGHSGQGSTSALV